MATSDQPAMLRSRGSFVATAIAEYFRDLGLNVLLMMDSVTRFAMSLREIGLAVGEPPTTKGYTPSVFSTLPKLLERAGNSSKGSITGIYSVLVEGDDMNDPVADQVRSILDGHIVLSRDLAEKQHYPAIDILSSLSRVMPEIISTEHTEEVTKFKELIKSYNEAEDLINIGAYKKGSNSTIDRAVSLRSKMNEFLCQKTNERFDLSSSINIVKDLMKSETNT